MKVIIDFYGLQATFTGGFAFLFTGALGLVLCIMMAILLELFKA